MRLLSIHESDRNLRFVVELADGAQVESVLYRSAASSAEPGAASGATLCVSCQVGCAVRCPFCASGAKGLRRPLSHDELFGQLRLVEERSHAVARLTVSGVGEPLHNAEVVARFVAAMRDRGTPASLTTSGGPLARLREALRWPHNGLTISVHAGTEAIRARMVPKGPALDPLFALLAEEVPRLSKKRRKKVALAYLLIADRNDAASELEAFAVRALPLGLRVHLYAFNPVPTSDERPVSREVYEAAYARLRAAGLSVHMSSKARLEANGGCGTLIALGRRAAASG